MILKDRLVVLAIQPIQTLLNKILPQMKEQLKQCPITQKIIEDNDIYWNRQYDLNIHRYQEYLEAPYNSQLSITMYNNFMDLAPLLMALVKLQQLKVNFEEILHKKHAGNFLQPNNRKKQFQNIKQQIYFIGLITLQNDNDREENISLTQKGIDTVCRFED